MSRHADELLEGRIGDGRTVDQERIEANLPDGTFTVLRTPVCVDAAHPKETTGDQAHAVAGERRASRGRRTNRTRG